MKKLLLAPALVLAAAATADAQSCLSTTFSSNNGGATGWANYMDVTVLSQTTVTSLEANFNDAAGSPVGLEVWTRSGTYVGSEQTSAGWTLVAMDDGTAIAAGRDNPTPVPLLASFDFMPGGVTGVAILYRMGGNAYTNGNGTNQTYTDGNMTIELGTSCSQPFVGGSLFDPRVWNGSFCTGPSSGVGTNYCTAIANSTGSPASISASGSAAVASNDLTLNASGLPTNAFGFFLTSQTQGLSIMPGGSQGNLCLGGSIGRYVGAGQIQNSGATGDISLALDLGQMPTPSGLVAANAGETWNFTAWFRDSVGGAATSNFTDGLSVDFQ